MNTRHHSLDPNERFSRMFVRYGLSRKGLFLPIDVIKDSQGKEESSTDADNASGKESIEKIALEIPKEKPATSQTPPLTMRAPRRRRTPHLKLFDPTAITMLRQQAQGLNRGHERRTAFETYIAPLAGFENGVAPLAAVPANVASRLARLKNEMPNFEVAIDTILPLLQLQRAGDRAIRLPPLLLDGPPGVGKSYFAQRLAETLSVHYAAIGLEATTAHWVISGANLTWQAGGPGIVFRALSASGHANPMILLDEVDKASSSERYSPLKALYALLETHTAQRFRDEAFPDLTLDASAVNWILTANDSSGIPAPLLSRMHRVNVPAPDAEQRRRIVAVVYRNLRAREPWGRRFCPTLQPRTIDALASLDDSVRQLQRVLVQACALAFASGRVTIKVEDVADVIRGPQPPIDLSTVPVGGHA